MTGLKLQIPATFSDTSLPLVYDDPIMSAGSLVLVDAAHSTGGFGAAGGVPADQAACPNVAWQTAKAILGAGDATTLSAKWVKSATLGAASILVERSGKKGLHVAVSQTVHVQGQGIYLDLPATVKTYMQANPTHSLYVSHWTKHTRVATSTSLNNRLLFFGDAANTGNNYRQAMHGVITGENGFPSTSVGQAQRLGARDGTFTDVPSSSMLHTEGTSALTGTNPATLTAQAFIGGSVGVANIATSLQAKPSVIFYRLYVEDLTVSGRTYGAVDALDLAQFTADVLTSGGRFNADTFTAPSTLP